MADFRFIHAADLHLGSPLQKLELYPGAPAELMRNATKRAVEKLIDLAIENQVQAVVIAGDIFDGKWRDISIGLWLAKELRRLERERINVYLIRGNHDAASVVRNAIEWPENVFEFPSNQPASYVLDCGLAIHGQSFEREAIFEDLAAKYPDARSGYFNVGVLHTSLTGNAEHDRYAPTEIPILRQRGYDYWALGHIHTRSTTSRIQQGEWIGYSGNTQGRSVRECGAKGCYLVQVQNGHVERMDFLPTDVARWEIARIDLTGSSARSEIINAAASQFQAMQLAAEDRLLAVRVQLTGRTILHRELGKSSFMSDVSLGIRNLANQIGKIWVEKIELATTPSFSPDQQSEFDATFVQLQETMATLQADPGFSKDVEDCLGILKHRAGEFLADDGWLDAGSNRLDEWSAQALNVLASELESSGGAS